MINNLNTFIYNFNKVIREINDIPIKREREKNKKLEHSRELLQNYDSRAHFVEKFRIFGVNNHFFSLNMDENSRRVNTHYFSRDFEKRIKKEFPDMNKVKSSEICSFFLSCKDELKDLSWRNVGYF